MVPNLVGNSFAGLAGPRLVSHGKAYVIPQGPRFRISSLYFSLNEGPQGLHLLQRGLGSVKNLHYTNSAAGSAWTVGFPYETGAF